MGQNSYFPEGTLINNSENTKYLSSKEALELAMKKGIILESTATLCYGELSLCVALCNGVKGIMPKEEVVFENNGETRDIAIITRVGKPICFKVTEIKEDNNETVAILSRKEAQKECFENYISKLTPGDIIDTKITHLEHFGAFCDIGCGIVSLLSIDCISVSRISHPKDRFFVGQTLKTVVKSIDSQTRRINVSRKELLGTWEENASLFAPGMTVAGKVRSVEDYGIFVELTPNLAGLAEYRDGVSIGQTAAVYIKSINPQKMKIKLVLIDSYKSVSDLSLQEYLSKTASLSHIDFWRYSPLDCQKTVETDFSAT